MRLIYNTTFLVENEIETAFIKSIQEFYIPFVKSKEMCGDILFTRVLVHEEEGKSLSLQLLFNTKEDYSTFIDLYRDKLLNVLVELFGEKMLHFNTTLEEVA